MATWLYLISIYSALITDIDQAETIKYSRHILTLELKATEMISTLQD